MKKILPILFLFLCATCVSAQQTGSGTGGTGQGTTGNGGIGASASGAVLYPSGANFVFDGDSRTAGSGSTAQCGASPCTIASNGYTATTTGTATIGSTALTIASGTGTANGEGVFGAGIAPGTTVTSGGGTTSIVLSTGVIAALSTTAVNFGNMDYPSQAMRLPQFSGRGTGYNLGVSGQSCGSMSARYATDAHTLSPAVTGKPGYFFLNCGTNSETAVTPTATGTGAQFTIVVSSITGIEIGDAATGTGIGAAAVVANTWDGTTTVLLTVANSGTVSGTITFTPSATSIAQAIGYVWSLAKTDGFTVIALTNPMHVAQSVTRNLNDSYNNLLRSYQGTNGYSALADVQSMLVDTYDPNTFASDAVHFKNQGYAVWAQAVANALILPGMNQTPERRYVNIGTGSSNTRYPDTCAYAMVNGGSNTCYGYGSFPVLTTGSFNSAFGDSDGTGLIGGAANLIIGHGIGNNLVSGGSNVILGGDTAADISFTVEVGVGASSTSNSSMAVGHNANASCASGSCFAFGGGAVASASGAVEIDPLNSTTNSTANTMAFESATPFIDAAGYLYGANKKFVTSDFTDSTSTTLTIITGLSWTLPTSRAVNMSFHCSLLFDQATAAVSDSFGVGVTGTAPTQTNASGTVFTSASVSQTGTLVALASTTPTAVVTFTPSAITTVWAAQLDGTIEQPSNATPGVFSIYAATTTGADNLIVKRGSYCSLF